MQWAIHILMFWALAFLSLFLALVLLNIFYGLIDSDLSLHSFGKEAVIAGVASLVEGASIWVVVSFIPAAARALIVPALVVGIIYKLSHLEDWSRYEVFALLLFQTVVSFLGLMLIHGKFGVAGVILLVFVIFLAIIASIAKSI